MGYDFVGEILTEPIEESVGIESIWNISNGKW